MLPRKYPLYHKNIHKLIVNYWEKIQHPNQNEKRARIPVLLSDKADFKSETVKRYEEMKGHCLQTKWINSAKRCNNCKYIYAPNKEPHKYMENILLDINWEIDSSVVRVGVSTLYFSQEKDHPDKNINQKPSQLSQDV